MHIDTVERERRLQQTRSMCEHNRLKLIANRKGINFKSLQQESKEAKEEKEEKSEEIERKEMYTYDEMGKGAQRLQNFLKSAGII